MSRWRATRATLIIVIACTLLLGPERANAQLCYSGDQATGLAWGTTNVKLYIHYDPTVTSGPGMGLRYALNSGLAWSQADVEFAVIRTLNIINEESGGKIKLQYSGTIASSTNPDHSIVLRAYNGSHTNPDCSNNASGLRNAFAVASSASSGGIRLRAQIAFFRRHGQPCNLINWNTNEADILDFPGVLMHELGHAFFDVGHPDDPAFDCSWSNEATIMRTGSGDLPPRKRLMKDWDHEIFQRRHDVRANFGSLYKNYKNSFGWGLAGAAPDTSGVGYLYRPGSATQNVPIRNIGFLHHFSTLPQLSGGGYPRNGRYNFGGFANQNVGIADSMIRPVATASRPGTDEIVVVYVARANGYGHSTADIGKICYRFSYNTGVTFSTETCQPTWTVFRNGLTAAYSARGNVFLIGFISDGDNVTIGAIPASGSSAIPRTSIIGFYKSWHAPAVACRADSLDASGCRLVWEDKTNIGCRHTLAAGFNPSTGQMSWSGTPASSPCFALYDTPGLAYNNLDNSFELLLTSKNDAIYAYKMASGSLSWSGDGDVWNSTNSFVLAAVAGFRASPVATLIQAWFVKYH